MVDFLTTLIERTMGVAQVAQPTVAPIFGPRSAPLPGEKDARSIRAEPKESSNASSDRIEPQKSTSRRTSVISSRPGSETSPISLEGCPPPFIRPQHIRRKPNRLSSPFDLAKAVPVEDDEGPSRGRIDHRTRGPSSAATCSMRDEESASVRREPEASRGKIRPPHGTEFHGEGQIARLQRETSRDLPTAHPLEIGASHSNSFELRPRSMTGPETTSHPETINRMTTGRPLRSDLQGAVSERPIIRVTIGRIDVRAVPPPAPPQQQPPPPAPGLSLDDYLKERNGGER